MLNRLIQKLRAPKASTVSKGTAAFPIEAVVKTLIRGVHAREPTDVEFSYWTKVLSEKPDELEKVALELFNSEENKERRNIRPNVLVDNSEFGEYSFLLKLLVRHGTKHGIIVDAGARGCTASNSVDLLRDHGWKGLLIEANPNLWDSIERDFHGLSFELVRNAVSDSEGTVTLYLGVNDDAASLDASIAGLWGPVRGTVEVGARKLGQILAEKNIPRDFDVLSLDLEGIDVRVLENLLEETDYRPSIVVIETSMGFRNTSLEDVPFSPLVRSLYRLSYQTWPNMILTLLPQNGAG
jgi:FkbM family methyltransferase